MISGGPILCLGVLATIVFFIAQAHKVTSGLFDSVHRSAKALEGASQVGLDQGKFRELLQGLSTELAIVKDKLRTEPDHKVFNVYESVFMIYHDSLSVWEIGARKAELRDAVDKKWEHYLKAKGYWPDDSDLFEQKISICVAWGKLLDQGWIPAYQVDVSIPGQAESAATMPKSKEINLKSVADKYGLSQKVEFGYAFLPSDSIQVLWNLARTKVGEVKKFSE